MSEAASALCVITARGGSKRIPRKNIRNFCGRPIIAYSIEAALESGVFDEVMVSTDDDEIADVARSCGAQVPFMRSAATSDDYATTADVLLEVLGEYEARGREFGVLCCVYPTAPFVTANELREAVGMIDAGAESVIPVASFDFPPLRAFAVGENDGLTYAFPDYATTRSQDLPEMVHDCGQFYVARVDAFRRCSSFMTPGVRAMRIPSNLVQDIDTLEDWILAEMKYQMLQNREA